MGEQDPGVRNTGLPGRNSPAVRPHEHLRAGTMRQWCGSGYLQSLL
ncbi:hypothetical protein ASZ90_011289 [hydrocarbon metagenome]|uniref:Uncharacterized protein n=1 Tax=hydrocarbon metagenome TaxID=938273 RepID=A0A0W8FDR8_9ZZZZ